MFATIPMSETALPPVGIALIPNAHDVELATESSRTLGARTQTTGDPMLTITGEGGATVQFRVAAPALCCSRPYPKWPVATPCRCCR
jgi:hypothetical protein